MRQAMLDKVLELLDEIEEHNAYGLLDVAREAQQRQLHLFAGKGAAEVKTLFEEWEPKRKDTLAQLPESSEQGVKARVFYHFLDNAYDKHRSEIRRLLAAEREAGITPASARVALERHEREQAGAASDGAGGGWVETVLRYLFEEEEQPQ